MRIYPDTSFWVALKLADDTHHAAAAKAMTAHGDWSWHWTPWHRVETFNSFRQFARGGIVAKADAARIIHQLDQEVRLGYWPHLEFSWTDAVRTAGELSAQHSWNQIVRSMDLFHVAVAVEIAADMFVSFDDDQLHLAKLAGLKTWKPSSALRR